MDPRVDPALPPSEPRWPRAWLSRTAAAVVAAMRRRPGLADAITAIALLELMALGVITVAPITEAPLWLALALAAATTAPLAWRRRAPLTVLFVVASAFTAFRLIEVPESSFSSVALFLAMYSAGAFGAPRRRDVVRTVAVALLMVLVVVQIFVTPETGPEELNQTILQVYGLALNLYFFAAAWVLGDVTRQRRETAAELAERNAQLVAERAENARRAVLAERVRIAREVHDVVAHHVSLMGIQAGAARHVLDRRPDAVGEALASIEASSRQAVGELQRLLGFLRADGAAADGLDGGDASDTSPAAPASDGAAGGDDPPVAAPQPRLADLPALVAHVDGPSLRVTLREEGDTAAVPTGVEVSAYRIVQEALTNTLRHAGARRADVIVRRTPDRLDVEVVDDGTGGPPAETAPDRGGLGLIGMRERVLLHGGSLAAGSAPGGGFTVRARFPLGGTP